MIKNILSQPVCLNLEKALQITKLFSDFDNDELSNVNILLENILKICKCDEIAYIQINNKLDENNFIISPNDSLKNCLNNNEIFKDILKNYIGFKNGVVLYNNDYFNKIIKHNDSFIIIHNVYLENKRVGLILALYKKDSLGYKLFNEIDLNYYQLTANIIASQEKSFRIKKKLCKVDIFRKNLNELSTLLYKTSSAKMLNYIQKCLEITCSLWNIDRGYLFIVDYELHKMFKTNEWCNEGVPSVLEFEKEVHIDKFPWNHILYRCNKEVKPIHLKNVDNELKNLIEKAELENNELLANTIKKEIDYITKTKGNKSVLLIPIIDHFKDENFTIGILGFTQVSSYITFKKDLIDTLQILSAYISEAIKRFKSYKLYNKNSKFMYNKLIEWQKENEEKNENFKILKHKIDKILKNSEVEI